jgi:hypothetical protein
MQKFADASSYLCLLVGTTLRNFLSPSLDDSIARFALLKKAYLLCGREAALLRVPIAEKSTGSKHRRSVRLTFGVI